MRMKNASCLLYCSSAGFSQHVPRTRLKLGERHRHVRNSAGAKNRSSHGIARAIYDTIIVFGPVAHVMPYRLGKDSTFVNDHFPPVPLPSFGTRREPPLARKYVPKQRSRLSRETFRYATAADGLFTICSTWHENPFSTGCAIVLYRIVRYRETAFWRYALIVLYTIRIPFDVEIEKRYNIVRTNISRVTRPRRANNAYGVFSFSLVEFTPRKLIRVQQARIYI